MKRLRTNRRRWTMRVALSMLALVIASLAGRGPVPHGVAARGAAAPPAPEAILAGVVELPQAAFVFPAQPGTAALRSGHPKLDAAMNSLAAGGS